MLQVTYFLNFVFNKNNLLILFYKYKALQFRNFPRLTNRNSSLVNRTKTTLIVFFKCCIIVGKLYLNFQGILSFINRSLSLFAS